MSGLRVGWSSQKTAHFERTVSPKGVLSPLEREEAQNGWLPADNKPTPTIKHAGIVKWWTLANFFVDLRCSV
jgi:hypothetical protein